MNIGEFYTKGMMWTQKNNHFVVDFYLKYVEFIYVNI